MNYNLFHSITNTFCESSIYLVPYINSTDFSCSLYNGMVTNITVENYFDLMQMLSYNNLDYSFVGRGEGNTSILLRNGNLIMPIDSFVTPSYVFCNILSNEDLKTYDLSENETPNLVKGVLDTFTGELLEKLISISNVNTQILPKFSETDISDILDTDKINIQEIKEEKKEDENLFIKINPL